jgi:hypothetical protein
MAVTSHSELKRTGEQIMKTFNKQNLKTMLTTSVLVALCQTAAFAGGMSMGSSHGSSSPSFSSVNSAPHYTSNNVSTNNVVQGNTFKSTSQLNSSLVSKQVQTTSSLSSLKLQQVNQNGNSVFNQKLNTNLGSKISQVGQQQGLGQGLGKGKINAIVPIGSIGSGKMDPFAPIPGQGLGNGNGKSGNGNFWCNPGFGWPGFGWGYGFPWYGGFGYGYGCGNFGYGGCTTVATPIVIEQPVVVNSTVPVSKLTLKLGQSYMVANNNFGSTAGELAVQISGLAIPLRIDKWDAENVGFTLPTLGLTDPVDGTFQVTDSNHHLIKTVAVTVLPADPVTVK